jgi:hypothetical protein
MKRDEKLGLYYIKGRLVYESRLLIQALRYIVKITLDLLLIDAEVKGIWCRITTDNMNMKTQAKFPALDWTAIFQGFLQNKKFGKSKENVGEIQITSNSQV